MGAIKTWGNACWGVVLATELVATVGCGSGASRAEGNGTATSAIPFDQLPTEMAERYCAVGRECETAVGVSIRSYGDDCEPLLQVWYGELFVARFAESVQSGAIVYHGDLARSCVNQLFSALCNAPSEATPQACVDTFEGTVPGGGACKVDEVCAGDAICRLNTTCPGTCSERSSAGGYCDFNVDCGTGLICANSLAQCVAPQPVGAECDGSALPCDEDAYCAPNEADPAAPSTCVPDYDYDLGEGETCSGDDYLLCASDLRCVFAGSESGEGVCTHYSATAGGPCQASYPPPCPAGQYCDASGDEARLNGTCLPVPTTGQPCGVAAIMDRRCGIFDNCVDDVCVTLQPTGGACQADAECLTYQCVDGVCSADPCADFVPSTGD